jgi:hypothetical protein
MWRRFALWRCRVLGWHPQSQCTLVSFSGAGIATARYQCGRCGEVFLLGGI